MALNQAEICHADMKRFVGDSRLDDPKSCLALYPSAPFAGTPC